MSCDLGTTNQSRTLIRTTGQSLIWKTVSSLCVHRIRGGNLIYNLCTCQSWTHIPKFDVARKTMRDDMSRHTQTQSIPVSYFHTGITPKKIQNLNAHSCCIAWESMKHENGNHYPPAGQLVSRGLFNTMDANARKPPQRAAACL